HIQRCFFGFFFVTVEQGGTAILSCYVTGTNDDLTQITWQRKTREKPHNDNFLTILPREGVQFVNGRDDRFKYIGNFNDKNGTLQLSNVALKDEGRYTCIFTLFPSGNQKTEITLNLLVPPFTNIKDNLPTLGTEEVLFATCTAAGSKPPAEVRWLTGALGDKVRTTTNSTQYDNDTTTTVSSLFGVPTREINGHQVQCVISGGSLSTDRSLPFTIQIYCEYYVISEDSSRSCFSRSGQSLLESSVKVDGAKLQLLSLTSDINGLYQCEASNTYGSKRGQLYVHVASGEVSLDLAVQFVQIFFKWFLIFGFYRPKHLGLHGVNTLVPTSPSHAAIRVNSLMEICRHFNKINTDSTSFNTTLVSYEAAPLDGLSERYSYRSQEPRRVIRTVL
uniref:Ig-like domain-containing protein n=1 Tax=Pundamilia nyererei TaxID=303518 RepID=A0A3B4FIW5_9CICH